MIELSALQTSSTVVIAASPDLLYDMIADVTRIGEFSPVCKSCWWDDGAGSRVGAWFTGKNVMGDIEWERRCQVVAAEPGRHFAWIVGGEKEGPTRWGYRFTPVAGGTEVEESWAILRVYPRIENMGDAELLALRDSTLAGIQATLANLKQAAEA
ncbi:MAG TPA: SRPBCC family protein [Acidimicrobiales bacterium]|nr:SRPBCC family protein [Acidimicrobiales bacterium]